MLPYLIAGAIGYGIAKLFESEDEAPKYAEGGILVGENDDDNKFPTKEEAFELIQDSIDSQGTYFIDEDGDGMFESEEQAQKYVDGIYDFFHYYYSLGMIPVYRGVKADEVDLDPYDIGESWSLYLDNAKQFASHLGSSKELKIISGYVPNNNVDWESAFRLYPLFSDFSDGDSEFELPIPSNNKIFNVQVSDYKNAQELEPYKYAEGGLIAPNGKPSNLTPEQYKLVRTKAFKDWFGDWENDPANASKVVDENGEPMICYHATDNKFWEFKKEKQVVGYYGKGFYFSNSLEKAKQYGKRVIPAFLNIKSVFELSDETPQELLNQLAEANVDIVDLGEENDIEQRSKYTFGYASKNSDIFMNNLIKNGYYGIRMIYDLKSSNYFFIVFEPNQIKLADGTNTTFDGNNPDIRFDGGGEVNKKLILDFVNQIETYQSNHYGTYNRDNLVNSYLKLPVSFKEKIKPKITNNLYRGADGFTSSKSAISFTKNKEYSNFFGVYSIPFNTIKKYDGLIDTERLGNELGKLRIDNEIGDDEGEVIVLNPVFKEELFKNIEEYRNYADGGSVLLAPNGKPSNLNPEQYKLVRTPEFKAWFGDWENDPANASKVVDSNGEPLVVYHGTDMNFSIFKDKDWFYFTPNKNYAQNIKLAKGYGDSQSKYIVPCFLKIKHLVDFDKHSIPINHDFVKNNSWKFEKLLYYYSGIVGIDYMSNNVTTYAVTQSNQIKLADGTNTTFDGNNPDIRYAGGGNILLAPNGKPSNLTPEQYKLVRTKAFKEWFGDWENDTENSSKVVDENGEPLVVWRGVRANNYYEYQKKGYVYFAKNKSYAQIYGDTLYPFFLNIRNPLDLEFFNKISSENGLTSFNNEGLFQIGETQLNNQFENELDLLYMQNLNDVYTKFDYLFKNGDGIVGYDIGSYGEELVFVTKQPNQIKLADGTNTTFDGNNPDIRFDGGGEVIEVVDDWVNNSSIMYSENTLNEIKTLFKNKIPNELKYEGTAYRFVGCRTKEHCKEFIEKGFNVLPKQKIYSASKTKKGAINSYENMKTKKGYKYFVLFKFDVSQSDVLLDVSKTYNYFGKKQDKYTDEDEIIILSEKVPYISNKNIIQHNLIDIKK